MDPLGDEVNGRPGWSLQWPVSCPYTRKTFVVQIVQGIGFLHRVSRVSEGVGVRSRKEEFEYL